MTIQETLDKINAEINGKSFTETSIVPKDKFDKIAWAKMHNSGHTVWARRTVSHNSNPPWYIARPATFRVKSRREFKLCNKKQDEQCFE